MPYNTLIQCKQTMNPQVKAKWIDALRSGEYQQGDEALQNDDGFCCLGVLCDLYSKEKGLDWKVIDPEDAPSPTHNRFYFDGESEFLPLSVQEWAELQSNNPEVVECDEEFIADPEVTVYISHLNDTGYSFNKLADIIEAQL